MQATSHFSSTVNDEIEFADDHEKSQENTESSDDAAEVVNSNSPGNCQQYFWSRKRESFP